MYFTSRSESNAKSARNYVHSKVPDLLDDKLIWLPLDLSIVKSVIRAIEEIHAKETKVDVLSMSFC